VSVLVKLNEARAKFHSLELKKTGHNKFAGYYYFELGDFLIPALQVFNEVGLCGVISFEPEMALMRITDLEDNSSVTITSPMSSAALKGCHEVQNLGAVQTYLRRYLWVAALEIVEHDAVDASEPVKPEKAVKLIPLTAEEGEFEHQKWTQVKAQLVNEDGSPDQEAQANAWGKLPSNVRTAIRAYGESLKEVK